MDLANFPMPLTDAALATKDEREFIAQKAAEFQQFASERARKSEVDSTFQHLTQAALAARDFADAVASQVEFAKAANFSGSIVAGVHAHPLGSRAMHLIAKEFSGHFVISRFGDEIIKIATQEADDAANKLARFRKENAADLKALGLI